MSGDEAISAVMDALEAASIPYMLVGSFSSNYYGIPRSTEDADFVLEIGTKSIQAITRQLGPQFRLDPQMSFESATGTSRHVLELLGSPFRIEMFHLSEDPHDQERFRRRVKVAMLHRHTFLPTAEDVLITKLRWFLRLRRQKDHDDARDVIAVQAKRLDWGYLHHWCGRHGTRELLEAIRQSIPSDC